MVEARAGAGGTQLLEELLDRWGVDVVPFDEAQAREALVAWRRFGKGRHPAGLNLGDVYGFALARPRGRRCCTSVTTSPRPTSDCGDR